MDLNPLLFHKKPLLLTNMEKNPINYYGILFILLLDMLTLANSLKWITMNYVLELMIVIFVLQIFTVVGVNLPEDVCLETKNMLFALLLVLMDGFLMLSHVLVKFMLACSLMLPLKLPVLSPQKWLNPNSTLEPYCITKPLFLPLQFWEPRELNMKLLEQTHFLVSKFLMINMKLLNLLLDKSTNS